MMWNNFQIIGNTTFKEIKHKTMFLTGFNKLYPFKLSIKDAGGFTLLGELTSSGEGYMAFNIVILRSLKGKFNLLGNSSVIQKQDHWGDKAAFNTETKQVCFSDLKTIGNLHNFLDANDEIDIIFRSPYEDDRISKLDTDQIIGLKETLKLYLDLVNCRIKLP